MSKHRIDDFECYCKKCVKEQHAKVADLVKGENK